MKKQSASQIGKFLVQYPSLAKIYSDRRFSLDADSTVSIRFQRTDTDFMYYKPRNFYSSGRGYIFRSDMPDLRGTRNEHLYACTDYHSIVGEILPSEFDEKSLVIKDVFNKLRGHFTSDAVSYLILVTKTVWYNSPSEQEKEADVTFGTFHHAEVEMILYPKPKKMSWQELVDKATKIKDETENAYKFPPKKTPALPRIHQLLRAGARIHGFSSGGGLRVVYTGELVEAPDFYGEAPTLEEALKYLEEDILLGHLPYEEFYGKLHPHYLTGTSMCTSNIDAHVRMGHTFDATWEKDHFQVIIYGYTHTETPKDIEKACREFPGIPFLWHERGYEFISVYGKFIFANGEPALTTNCLNQEKYPGRGDAFFYRSKLTGTGSNIWQAFQSAINATPEEIRRDQQTSNPTPNDDELD